MGEVFTGLAYFIGALAFYLAAKERRLATEGMGRLALYGFFFGILGAKVTQVIAEGGSWEALMRPSLGGRALLGGLVFGWLAVAVAKWGMGIKVSTGPMFALALPAGEAVGRIGCFLNGCCYGTACDLPWSVYQHGEFRHPSQLYSSVYSALLFALLFTIRNRLDGRALFRLYLLGWGLGRFAIEFFREGNRPVFGLSIMQAFALEIAVVTAVGILIIHLRKPEARPAREVR